MRFQFSAVRSACRRRARLLLFAFAAAFGFAGYGCNKAEDKKTDLDIAVKQAFNFLPGSYWIFRDSLSNRYDSFFVTSNSRFYTGNKELRRERIEIGISAYGTGAGSGDTFGKWGLFLDNVNQVQFLFIDPGHNGDTFKFYNYAPVSYPFTDGSYRDTRTENDTVSIVRIQSIVINGTAFTDGTSLTFQNSYARGAVRWQFRDTFYICESAGLLKISLNHIPESFYRTWNLVRWNIVR